VCDVSKANALGFTVVGLSEDTEQRMLESEGGMTSRLHWTTVCYGYTLEHVVRMLRVWLHRIEYLRLTLISVCIYLNKW
jgi:hypothetical protein